MLRAARRRAERIYERIDFGVQHKAAAEKDRLAEVSKHRMAPAAADLTWAGANRPRLVCSQVSVHPALYSQQVSDITLLRLRSEPDPRPPDTHASACVSEYRNVYPNQSCHLLAAPVDC